MVPTLGSECSRPRRIPREINQLLNSRDQEAGDGSQRRTRLRSFILLLSSLFFENLFQAFLDRNFPAIRRTREVTNEIVPFRRRLTSLEAMEDSHHKIIWKGGQGTLTLLSAATRSVYGRPVFLLSQKNLPRAVVPAFSRVTA